MRPITIHKNRIEISPAYRIVAGVSEFDIYSIGALIVGGSLTVKYFTGQEASTKIEYSYTEATLNQSITLAGFRKFHEIPFPNTFVDTTHFFRIITTSAEGITKTSEIFKVFVGSKLFNSSEVFAQETSQVRITVLEHKLPDAVIKLNSEIRTDSNNSSTADIFTAYKSVNILTIPSAGIFTPIISDESFKTNIKSTTVQ